MAGGPPRLHPTAPRFRGLGAPSRGSHLTLASAPPFATLPAPLQGSCQARHPCQPGGTPSCSASKVPREWHRAGRSPSQAPHLPLCPPPPRLSSSAILLQLRCFLVPGEPFSSSSLPCASPSSSSRPLRSGPHRSWGPGPRSAHDGPPVPAPGPPALSLPELSGPSALGTPQRNQPLARASPLRSRWSLAATWVPAGPGGCLPLLLETRPFSKAPCDPVQAAFPKTAGNTHRPRVLSVTTPAVRVFFV